MLKIRSVQALVRNAYIYVLSSQFARVVDVYCTFPFYEGCLRQ